MQNLLLILLSFVLVAFGQPAWSWLFGLIASICGYALFWKVLIQCENPKQRFYFGVGWFSAVQLIQLSWSLSHPYSYVFFVLPLFAAAIGAQFGLICLFINKKNIHSTFNLLILSGLWTLLEWIRLFFFSGFSWNPVGIALTGSVYSLQIASLAGIYGLSFWVIFVNLLVLRSWMKPKQIIPIVMWVLAAFFPYFYGTAHLKYHTDIIAKSHSEPLNTVLVQTAFPPESSVDFKEKNQIIAYALDQWKEVFSTLKNKQHLPIDLIVMPEYVIMCGTHSCLYPYTHVETLFQESFGPESIAKLPPRESPLATTKNTQQGPQPFVSNAFITQGIANQFRSGVIIGLEDAQDVDGIREHYSAALYFKPCHDLSKFAVERYEKRILVPLGEYIPFDFFREIAAAYGIKGSFTSGKSAKVFKTEKIPFGLSICYEETFGHVMKDNKMLGAGLLVNLTSDAWYPYSRLGLQHFTHALVRTVENGIPLIRSTNLGVTAAVDSLGRLVGSIESTTPQSIYLQVPTYNYNTLYTYVGDYLIIGFSLLLSLFSYRLKVKS